MAPLSLSQLLDVAIETPEAGVVNFTALHSLLQAMLGHLGLRDMPAQVEEEQLAEAQSGLKKRDKTEETGRQPQEPGKDSLQGTESSPQVASVAADVGQMKMEANESGISKDLLGEMGRVKVAQFCMEEDIRTIQEALGLGNLQDAASQLPVLHDQSALDSDVEGTEFAPTKPPILDMDTPPGASSALGLKGPQTQPVPRTSNEAGMGTPGIQPGSPGMQITTPEMQPGSPGTQTTTPGMQPGSPGTHTTTPEMQPGSPSTHTTTPEMQPGSPGTQTTSPRLQSAHPGIQGGSAEIQLSSTSMEPSLHGAEKVPDETTPGDVGTQIHPTSPQEGGKALPSVQLAQAGHLAAESFSPTAQELEMPLNADVRVRSSSQELDVPCSSSGSTSVPSCSPELVEVLHQIGQLGQLYATLKEQVAQLEATKLDHSEVEKLCQLFLERDQESITSVLADLQAQMSSLQGLASELQEEKEKIRQLEDALVKLEVAGADSKADGSNQIVLQRGAMLQEIKQELKELREQQEMTKSTLEEMVTRIPDQLQEQLDKLKRMVQSMGREQGELQAEGQAECPVCSTDLSVQVGQLLQRYEKFQELVDSFTSQQLVCKVARQLPDKNQDEELLKLIQATIVLLQEDYKKLSSVTGNLLNDSQQKQKDIEALFQSLERLEKEKTDKEDLLLRIDAKADKSALASNVSRSQFEASMERLNEVIQEMLSRVTGQEQGWHQFQRQLSEEMDAKLDRVELGPFQQQLEQHWRSILEKAKKKGPAMEADGAAGIKKQLLAPFHCLSCDWPLRMVVPGPHMVSIPSMPPLPSRFAGDPSAILKQEQMQQDMHREWVPTGRYPRVPRSCGGQHTLGHPLQRRQTLLPQPPALLPSKHNVVELLGQDGNIYRGQQDEQLPVLVGKEGFLRDKPKLSPGQWDAQDKGHLLSRPQNDRSLHSQLGTPASPEHRPASPHSSLSQASGLLPTLGNGSRTSSAGQD